MLLVQFFRDETKSVILSRSIIFCAPRKFQKTSLYNELKIEHFSFEKHELESY